MVDIVKYLLYSWVTVSNIHGSQYQTFMDLLLHHKSINPFVPNASFLYPLKTSENLMFSGSREKVHWEQLG